MRLLVGAVRYRRIDGVDLFLTMLLVIAALVSLIGGGPRVLLFKNAALSLAVGGWALGTAFTRRPLAFQLGQHLHTGSAVPRTGRDLGGTAHRSGVALGSSPCSGGPSNSSTAA
ncbi:hypothetical protein LT493_39675 [Streptomyces tricolor]|nr:hypothetical protein [Streptomyces tricolor]